MGFLIKHVEKRCRQPKHWWQRQWGKWIAWLKKFSAKKIIDLKKLSLKSHQFKFFNSYRLNNFHKDKLSEEVFDSCRLKIFCKEELSIWKKKNYSKVIFLRNLNKKITNIRNFFRKVIELGNFFRKVIELRNILWKFFSRNFHLLNKKFQQKIFWNFLQKIINFINFLYKSYRFFNLSMKFLIF